MPLSGQTSILCLLQHLELQMKGTALQELILQGKNRLSKDIITFIKCLLAPVASNILDLIKSFGESSLTFCFQIGQYHLAIFLQICLAFDTGMHFLEICANTNRKISCISRATNAIMSVCLHDNKCYNVFLQFRILLHTCQLTAINTSTPKMKRTNFDVELAFL